MVVERQPVRMPEYLVADRGGSVAYEHVSARPRTRVQACPTVYGIGHPPSDIVEG